VIGIFDVVIPGRRDAAKPESITTGGNCFARRSTFSLDVLGLWLDSGPAPKRRVPE
jgi:hypothetical protein